MEPANESEAPPQISFVFNLIRQVIMVMQQNADKDNEEIERPIRPPPIRHEPEPTDVNDEDYAFQLQLKELNLIVYAALTSRV